MDAGEILSDYQLTRFPDQFYRLKIGIPWEDLERRLDVASVLSLCTEEPMLEQTDDYCVMGVDTGKALHVVILKPDDTDDQGRRHRLVHAGIYRQFEQLDELMSRFHVDRCVIDAMPETHKTREFALRHRGDVFMSFFSDTQRGAIKWDDHDYKVEVNRTEALDASSSAIRDKLLILPRQLPIIEQFAKQQTGVAKKLEVDEQTGAQAYRYFKTAENHFAFALTYAWMATADVTGFRMWMRYFRYQAKQEGRPWPPPRSR